MNARAISKMRFRPSANQSSRGPSRTTRRTAAIRLNAARWDASLRKRATSKARRPIGRAWCRLPKTLRTARPRSIASPQRPRRNSRGLHFVRWNGSIRSCTLEPAMVDFWKDLRHALQMFARNPSFTIAAVAALALGIGANTAIFTVVNAVLLKPLTYPDADRMVDFLAHTAGLANNIHSIPEFHFFERQTKIFKEVVAYDNAGPGFNLTGGHPEQVHGIHVTEGYFRVYGAPVVLGRTFTA